MSENSTPEERTESPTERRLGQLRREGGLHLSNELVVVTSLLTSFLVLQMIWSWLLQVMKDIMIKSFRMIGENEQLDFKFVYDEGVSILIMAAPPVFVLACAVAGAAALAVFLQTNWNIKGKWIDFKVSELSPMKGIKRIFSLQSFVMTLKSICKLALILPIAYFALKRFAPEMVMLIHLGIEDVMVFTGVRMSELFWKVMYILIALAIFDYFYTKWQWLRTNRMTKEEVKDERKAIEGDEQTKRRIQMKGLERIVQRIKSSVPQADVVITNPTQYSIALKYDRERMDAPIVVAKGKGFLAKRIREIAKASGVPILERKVLARALYRSTEVGSEIPHALFKAVAEVLAYVYKLKRKTFIRTART